MTEKKSLGKKKNYHKEKEQLISFTYLHYVVTFEETALYLPLFLSSPLFLSKVKGVSNALICSPPQRIEILESGRYWQEKILTGAYEHRCI